MNFYQNAVIFGGGGYIAAFFADALLANNVVGELYLADIRDPKRYAWSQRVHDAEAAGIVKFIQLDVRNIEEYSKLPQQMNLIANFAAVHREPGHEPWEYYETNIAGAENVCAWADQIQCRLILFTSSISPYGTSPLPRYENSLPVPITAYGGSKLVAEKIHEGWFKADPNNKRLIIVRPGVVYGPAEDGNVPRLIKAVVGRYFIFTGNRNTSKAGGYVKELANTMIWTIDLVAQGKQNYIRYNFSMPNPPTMQDYVNTICKTVNIKRFVPSVPFSLIYNLSLVMFLFGKLFGIKHPFDPIRIKKLVVSSPVVPQFLLDNGYQFKYDLESAFADWYADRPEDWIKPSKES